MNSISKKKIYIFDANVFINLHRIDMHSIRLPDEVWVKLDELMMDGKIISHRTVYDEVVSGSKIPTRYRPGFGLVKIISKNQPLDR